MHDANQDRLTIQRLTYFLASSACASARPTSGSCSTPCSRARPSSSWSAACGGRPPESVIGTSSSTALGGATPEEYLRGERSRTTWDGTARASCGGTRRSRMARVRRRSGASSRHCVTMLRFARERGYRVRRIVFDEPEALSPLVADLYRWWYRARAAQRPAAGGVVHPGWSRTGHCAQGRYRSGWCSTRSPLPRH